MDTDISHSAQAIFDDHEARLAAIEDHLGISNEEDDEVVDDENGEEGE